MQHIFAFPGEGCRDILKIYRSAGDAQMEEDTGASAELVVQDASGNGKSNKGASTIVLLLLFCCVLIFPALCYL